MKIEIQHINADFERQIQIRIFVHDFSPSLVSVAYNNDNNTSYASRKISAPREVALFPLSVEVLNAS